MLCYPGCSGTLLSALIKPNHSVKNRERNRPLQMSGRFILCVRLNRRPTRRSIPAGFRVYGQRGMNARGVIYRGQPWRKAWRARRLRGQGEWLPPAKRKKLAEISPGNAFGSTEKACQKVGRGMVRGEPVRGGFGRDAAEQAFWSVGWG